MEGDTRVEKGSPWQAEASEKHEEEEIMMKTWPLHSTFHLKQHCRGPGSRTTPRAACSGAGRRLCTLQDHPQSLISLNKYFCKTMYALYKKDIPKKSKQHNPNWGVKGLDFRYYNTPPGQFHFLGVSLWRPGASLLQ